MKKHFTKYPSNYVRANSSVAKDDHVSALMEDIGKFLRGHKLIESCRVNSYGDIKFTFKDETGDDDVYVIKVSKYGG